MPVVALGWWGHREVEVAQFTAGFLVGTLLITPDLDLQYNDAARRWGAFRILWGPYWRLSRHRGRSHTYLFGPFSRLAYLAVFLVPIGWLAWSELRPEWRVDAWVVRVLLGYLCAQWLHLMADGIWPFEGKKKRQRGR